MVSKNQEIGLAGEFRVMSELLLRGYNPAKAYLDDGVDIILDNGIRIQVKSSLKQSSGSKDGRYLSYHFNTRKGNDKKKIDPSTYSDYFIFWGVEDDVYWIMPSNIVANKGTMAFPYPGTDRSLFTKYINNWKLLKGGE